MKTPQIASCLQLSYVLVIGAGVGSVGAFGADPTTPNSPPKDEEPVHLTEMVVTGSYIPTAADATDVPVASVGTKDILDTGLSSNLLDILTKAMPEFAGRSNQGNRNATNTNVFTAGGSQIALRNLDTLILVNGRRVATSGISAVNGKSFVDINMIPTASIDHMEVLTDGASAIYGSDAIGGVVNIILKSNYNGGEMGARYAVSDNPGHYSERSGYVVVGGGNQRINLTVSGSWSKTDPVWQNQRRFVRFNPRSGTAFPGYVSGNYLATGMNSPSQTNPTGTNATAPNIAALVANGTYVAAGSSAIPPFNSAPYETIVEKDEQKGVSANLEVKVIDKKLVFFADYLYGRTDSFNQNSTFLGGTATTGGTVSTQFPIAPVPIGSPYNPTTSAVSGAVVGTLDTPVGIFNQSTGNRGTFGFRGEITPDLNWEIGAVYSQEQTNEKLTNQLFAPNLNAAIAGGYDANGNPLAGGGFSRVLAIGGYPGNSQYVIQPALDPFARYGVNPAARANIYGTEYIQTEATLRSYDAKVVYMPLDLPAGKLAIAGGAAWRMETISGIPDANSENLSTSPANHNWGSGALFFDTFRKTRTISSYFGEVRIPITGNGKSLPGLHALDVSLAGREEKYSDWGSSAVPKIGLRWQPFDDQLTLRFTYSKAYSAPRLYDEYGPPSVTIQAGNSFLYTNTLSPSGAGNSAFIGLPYFSGNGNNPSIQPSHAISRSFGFVASPKFISGLTIGVNYINVINTGLASGVGATAILQSVNQLGSASPFFSQLAVGGIPGTAGASQAALVAPFGLYNLLASGGYQGNLYILDHFINSGGVHEEAFDINPAYTMKTEGLGTFTVATNGTYFRHFLVSQAPGQPFYEFAGYSTNGSPQTGSFPRWRFYSTVDWKRNGWDLLVANTYTTSMTDILSGQIPAIYLQKNPGGEIAYYTSWDFQVSRTFNKVETGKLWSFLRGVTVSVGVNNVFNRMPPYAPLSQAASLNNNNVDVSTFSPIGRLFYVNASLKF